MKEQLKNEFLDKFGNVVVSYLKFTEKKEWAEGIVSGNLYMKPIKYYRDLETKYGIKGQGDSREVSLISEDVRVTITSLDTGVVIPGEAREVRIHYPKDEKNPIFCITGIKVKDLEIKEFDEESIKFKLPFTTSDLEQFKRDFGNYAVIIMAETFQSAIKGALEKQNINGYFGEVIYCENDTIEKERDFFNEELKRFMYKDADFSYQKEHRLVLDDSVVEERFFDVGSLKEYANLFEVDKLLDFEICIKYVRKNI